MNKTVVCIIAILAIAAVAGFYIWSSHNRYYIVTSAKGIAYEVDRKTGKSWALMGKRKIPQKAPEDISQDEKPLPYAEIAKITGNARLELGAFCGKIYNGSNWTITRIVINVEAKEEDGTIRWSHDFSERLAIDPLTTAHFSVYVTDEHGIKDTPWSIKEVFGYKK